MHGGSCSYRQTLSSQREPSTKEEEAKFGRGCRSQTSREGSYHTSFETKQKPYVFAASRPRSMRGGGLGCTT